MFKPVRIVATLVFLASIALVFVGAFVIGNEVRPPAPSPRSRSRPTGPLHRYVRSARLARLIRFQYSSSSSTSHTPGTVFRTFHTPAPQS
jgi:hypothetical protein